MKNAWAKGSIAALAAGYALSLATLWAKQDKLLFKPDPFSKLGQSLRAIRAGRALGRRVREWEHHAADGARIQAFISAPARSGDRRLPALIYLGGIREESSWTLPFATHFPDRAFVCLNYRGYGKSEGSPSERDILRDCESALREMEAKGEIDLAQSVLTGRSLGSGVAGYLCERVGALGCCLITPYDSVMAVARKKFWYVPMGLIFKHPFDALPWARRNRAPLLMVLAESDQTVPHEHSQRLYAAWAGEKSQLTLDKTDHSSVVTDERLFPLIARFTEGLGKGALAERAEEPKGAEPSAPASAAGLA